MENTALATKIREAKATLPTAARNTLKLFANEAVKKLHLVTKSYKYDFPFFGQANSRASNYRLACLLERQLLKRFPYIKDAVIPFMEKGRNGVSINLQPNRALTKYLTVIQQKARAISLPLEITFTTTRRVDNTGHEREVVIFYVSFTLSATMDSYGYVSFFYLESLIKILSTLQRGAFYA